MRKGILVSLLIAIAAVSLSSCTIKAKRSDYDFDNGDNPKGPGLFTGKKGEWEAIRR